MATPPKYYDHRRDQPAKVLMIDPVPLWGQGRNEIPELIGDFSAAIFFINMTWEQLQLGWAGQTRDEAVAFHSRWTALMKRLYGPTVGKGEPQPRYSDLGPDEGSLKKLGVAVELAASNLGLAEAAVVEMFKQVTSPADGDGQPPDDGGRDLDAGPIKVKNDPK